jgi:serine O-acetyltransferase
MFSKLRGDLDCILERDPAARSRWEVLTCYPGLHAIYIHKLAHWFWGHGLRWFARFTSHVGRWLTGIEIHPGAKIGSCVFIDHGMGIVVGETAEIGDGCTIYQGVTLGGTSLEPGTKRHPTLGPGVIVGAGAKVLGGFTVGAGARIGSNAIVVKEVPPGATVVAPLGKVLEKTREAERFSAYAVMQESDDPYAKAIQELVQHSQELERALQAVTDKLSRLEKADREQQLRLVK